MRINDVILKTATRFVSLLIFAFSIHVFLAGHHQPGGGFIGGLIGASAFILLFLAYGIETVRQMLPFKYVKWIATGLLLAVMTGVGSFLFDVPFLTHAFDTVYLPFFGEWEWATVLLFDIGVYLTVFGVTMTIILAIGEDEDEWK